MKMPDYHPDMTGGASDWHAIYTIQLGELVESGYIDFNSHACDFDAYDTTQRKRLYSKLYARYKYYEIGIVPPLRWQEAMIAKLNEIMPKYKPLYKALEDGYNPLQDMSERHRERGVDSTYPQTMLNGRNQDYASTGNELMWETIRDGSIIDTADKLNKRYNDVDVMILNELDFLFMGLTTANINGL